MTDGPDAFLEETFRAVGALPFSPTPHSARALWARVKGAADFVGHNVPAAGRLFVALNPYPLPFRLVQVPTADGGALSGWLGAGRPGAPGLLLTPGTFHTKDDTARKTKAIRAWRSWGWSVLAVDLRGFGGSHALHGSGGVLEARDVLDAARWLREQTGCGRVGVVGESLGGAAALVAAARPEARDVVHAITAWSPFADLAEVLRHVTAEDGARDPVLSVTRHAYRLMVRTRSRGRYRDFAEYLADRAKEMGVDVETLLAEGSPVRHVARVGVPTLVLHAEDDPVVPVRHARLLEEAARGNPYVRVRIVPQGSHLFFDAVDERWYWGVLDVFLRRVLEREATP